MQGLPGRQQTKALLCPWCAHTGQADRYSYSVGEEDEVRSAWCHAECLHSQLYRSCYFARAWAVPIQHRHCWTPWSTLVGPIYRSVVWKRRQSTLLRHGSSGEQVLAWLLYSLATCHWTNSPSVFHRSLSVIAAYAPTEAAALNANEDFYCKLGDTLSQCSANDLIICLGDFNAVSSPVFFQMMWSWVPGEVAV